MLLTARPCSDLVFASTKTSWPFKPTKMTPQADVDTFNQAFLALLALQLEFVPRSHLPVRPSVDSTAELTVSFCRR